MILKRAIKRSLFVGQNSLKIIGAGTNRKKMAVVEGIQINNEYWTEIIYMRRYYLEHGLPRHVRQPAQNLIDAL